MHHSYNQATNKRLSGQVEPALISRAMAAVFLAFFEDSVLAHGKRDTRAYYSSENHHFGGAYIASRSHASCFPPPARVALA